MEYNSLTIFSRVLPLAAQYFTSETMNDISFWLWLLGGIGGMIVILLGVIAYFIKSDRDGTVSVLKKHEDWILGQQNEIHEISTNTRLAIQLIQSEQKNNNEKLEILFRMMDERSSNKKSRDLGSRL